MGAPQTATLDKQLVLLRILLSEGKEKNQEGVHEMFLRNFWNPEQKQLSEMPPGNGVIYKANPRPPGCWSRAVPGPRGRPDSAQAPPITNGSGQPPQMSPQYSSCLCPLPKNKFTATHGHWQHCGEGENYGPLVS